MEDNLTNKHCIIKEHDKICILEKIIQMNQKKETIVSNFIDALIDDNLCLSNKYLKSIYENFEKDKINLIVTICHSIVERSPLFISSDYTTFE